MEHRKAIAKLQLVVCTRRVWSARSCRHPDRAIREESLPCQVSKSWLFGDSNDNAFGIFQERSHPSPRTIKVTLLRKQRASFYCAQASITGTD